MTGAVVASGGGEVVIALLLWFIVTPFWVGVAGVVVVEEGCSVAGVLGLFFCFGPLLALFFSCLVVFGDARFLSSSPFLAGVGGAGSSAVVGAVVDAEASGGSGL